MTSASTFSDASAEERPFTPDTPLEPGPLQSEIQTLVERPFPDFSSGYKLHGHTTPEDPVWIIARQEALEQIRAHSISNLRTELGGVLLGRAYRCEDRLLLIIKAALPATSQDHGPSHFTFAADSWTQIHQDKAEQYPDLDIVGWFHTHPALGVFYSSDDVVVHSAAFTLPWHVGLVVDPIRNEASFFGWEGETLAPFTGFYEKLDPQPHPVVKWQVVRTSVRHMTYLEDDTQFAPGMQMAAVQPAGSNATFLGFLAAGAALLITFFFLVGWVVTLNRQVNQMETVISTLANESLADSNAALCPDPNLRLLAPLTGTRIAAGETVSLLGTADIADATRYQMQVRISGTEAWSDVDNRRFDTPFGQIGRWNTTDWLPGTYELRLTAVDNNNIRLSNSLPCQISLELVP